ncbi:MAG: tRNA epoxyqueuosine(34) reductase QueG [Candidatus Acidiferrales bacterium]|jgi:epoxyqueuosine reductase
MTPAERTRWIGERARAAGFDLCGVAPAAPEELGELSRLPEWLARGFAGEMKYLHDSRRADPRSVLQGARSLIVVALNYNSAQPASAQLPADAKDESPRGPRGLISRYAWGDDYHDVIRQKLAALIEEMRAQFLERFEARAYADTGPIVERVAAKHAGLGWLAKNTCLIHPQLGSWLFLGVIVTTLALEPSLAPGAPPPPDLCGSCTRCLDACPTQAFPEPYVLDARRCISYLTIELRGAIPEEFREQMGRNVIGCDICQDVCPWNRKAPVTSLAAFEPRQTLFAPELEWLASLSQQEFSAVFRGSAVKRAKWRGLVRNACVALGNSSIAPDQPAYPRVIRLLDRLASSEDAMISGHARWALVRLSGSHDQPAPDGLRVRIAESKTE